MDNIQKQLGIRLRALRIIRQYSIEELAHKAGLNPAHLGKIERGERNFTIQSLDKIVKALETSYSIVFNFGKEIPPVDNPIIKKTVSYLTAMSTKEQDHIYKTVQMLADKK
ncbi:MAG TPA: helix-turn-helix transcriptional regulator [Anaerovoracaceae bacterium]|nr:helix-turn-helix transcriptional regulator [Anaerovoracaceae bacterium]